MKKIAILLIVALFVGGINLYASNKKFTVVIDAGHGGRDPGAIRGKIKEKDINLGVAKELGRLIAGEMSDVDVVYTRQTDVFVDLEKRSQIANKAKANLFISIHTNSTAATTTRASGADTYILGLARSAENLAVAKRENSVIKYEDDYTTKYEGFDPDSPESYIIFEFMTNQYMQQSLDIASYIQKDFKSVAKRVDRGVRQAGFLVLRESSMPSILIELGFINNPTEAKYLSTAAGQNEMAKAIFSGFRKYKNDFVKRDGGGAPSNSANVTTSRPVSQVADTPKSSPRPVAQPTVTPKSSANTSGQVEYRVQFLYAIRKLPEGSSLFRGIVPTGYTEDNGIKYTVGSTTDYNEILRLQAEVRKVFKDAFVVRVEPSTGVKMQSSQSNAPTTNVTQQRSTSSGRVEYYIQFLYSPTKLSDNSPRFKGLANVTFYHDGGYKYIVGGTTDYQQILRLHNQVKTKFKDAFVIRMRDGKRL